MYRRTLLSRQYCTMCVLHSFLLLLEQSIIVKELAGFKSLRRNIHGRELHTTFIYVRVGLLPLTLLNSHAKLFPQCCLMENSALECRHVVDDIEEYAAP